MLNLFKISYRSKDSKSRSDKIIIQCLSMFIYNHYLRRKDIKNILYLQIIPAEIVPICQLVHTFHQFIAFQPLPHKTTPPFGRVAKYNRRTGVNGLNRRLCHYFS